jgi:hypothetical protein
MNKLVFFTALLSLFCGNFAFSNLLDEKSNNNTRSVIFSKDFEDQSITSGGWEAYSVLGDQVWEVPASQYGLNNTYCAKMEGYDGSANENEDWLISPEFVPDDYDNLYFSFWNTCGYSGADLQVFYAYDYTGDPSTANWIEITDAIWHDGVDFWEWTFSGNIDLSALTGTSCHIGFKYISTDSDGKTWELDDIVLTDQLSEADGVAKFVADGLAIDGYLDEPVWDVSIPIAINPDGSDNTANFDVLWDDEYLYVGVEVSDDILVNDGRQAFFTDGVEIAVDGAYNQSFEFDNNDLLLAKAIQTFWLQEQNLNTDGIVNKYVETLSGYTMEFAIPWSIMNINPVAGNSIGFNVAVNDDDGNTVTNMPKPLIWYGHQNYFVTPGNWGELSLSGEQVGYNGEYIALLYPNQSEFLIQGKTAEIQWHCYDISTVKIEYSTDNGSNWETIVESANATEMHYDWLVDAPASEQMLIRISDATNSLISDQSAELSIVSDPLNGVEPLITALWHNYRWPYNAYYPEDENSIPVLNGNLGNACGPSTLARLIHAWEFPRKGSGSLSFTDNYGTNWSADFENTIYDYDKMPLFLDFDASESEYDDVATLMYHTAVSMHDEYGSGTTLDNFSYLLNTYFNYKESDHVFRNNYSKAEWTQILMNELDNGRSLIVTGMNPNNFGWHESNNIGGHWYNCDGYNENGEFHVIVGFGEYQYDGYYSVDEFPLYPHNIAVLIGVEPDFNGKTLSLIEPNGGELYVAGDQINITWEADAVANVTLEYTLDNGQSWVLINDNVDASAESYLWTTPNSYSDECRIRITDNSDINIYDKSDSAFINMLPQLVLSNPIGGESFVYDAVAVIKWQLSPISEIDILYSIDNGSSWNEIVSNYDASICSYEWVVPAIETNQALIKIVNSSDNSNYCESESVFKIMEENVVGGPYENDENTLVSLHFEGSLYNQSELTNHPALNSGDETYASSANSDMGKSFFFNDYLTIPHTDALNLTDDWTIEFWFKPTAFNSGLNYYISKPGDNDLYFANYAVLTSESWSNVFFGFYFSDEDRIMVQSTFYPQLDQWYHVSFIRNTSNSTISIVVRNVQREIIHTYITPDTGDEPLTNNQDLLIGLDYTGYMDEVRISNVVRSFEPVGLQADSQQELSNIYPNPTSNHIQIGNICPVKVEIYSLNGVCVFSKRIVDINANLDVSELPSGLYVLQIKSDNKIQTHKLVIDK